MRIGIDAHNLEGKPTGVGRYLLNILSRWPAILPEHAEVFLYCKQEIPRSLKNFADARFRVRLCRPPWKKQSNALYTHLLLPQRARADNLDILWCPAYVAPLMWTRPLALTLHDIIFSSRPDLYDWPSYADRIILAWVARRSAQKARTIFVPSLFSKQEVVRVYRVPEERLVVTPLAADALFRNPIDSREIERAKARYGIPERYFLFYGSLFSRRHIPESALAFSRIQKQFPDSAFLIGGADHTKKNFPALVKELNVRLGADAIKYVPYLEAEELPALLHGASALVWLSEYEGFGLPVLEALQCRTPVITSRSGSLPEVAAGCALYIRNPDDTEEIAEAMRSILMQESFARDLKTCGPERASRFSWESCAAQTLRALIQ